MRIETNDSSWPESLVTNIDCFHSNIRDQQKHIPCINELGKCINEWNGVTISCSSSFVYSLGQLTVGLALRASIANSQLPLSKALYFKME